MRNYVILAILSAFAVALLCGCGGGEGSMMLKIVDPVSGATVSGNRIITATMLNPAMATGADFSAGSTVFASVAPATVMSARLDTLSLGLPNGPVTVTVQTNGNIYTASVTLNVNNGRSLFVQDTSGNSGNYVTVHVRLNDFALAGGYHLYLVFDTSKLQLNPASVAKGAGVPPTSSFVVNTGMPGVLEATVSGSTAFTSGDVLTASFQIRAPSPPDTRNDIVMLPAPTLVDTAGTTLVCAGVDGCIVTN